MWAGGYYGGGGVGYVDGVNIVLFTTILVIFNDHSMLTLAPYPAFDVGV